MGNAELVELINKKFKKNLVSSASSQNIVKCPRISSGILAIDYVVGGGYPLGRIVEIYGPESSGKSHAVTKSFASATSQDSEVYLQDEEGTFDETFAASCGVNLSKLYKGTADFGEQAMDLMELIVQEGDYKIVALDSVDAVVPKAILETTNDKAHMGRLARLMSSGVRKITKAIEIAKRNGKLALVIFTNQVRMKLGGYGNPETTPGGMALKFYASIRLEVRRSKYIRNKAGNTFLHRTRVTCQKNKTAPPFKTMEYDVFIGQPLPVGLVDDFKTLNQLMVKYGLIQKKGAWISFPDGSKVQGDAKAAEKLVAEFSASQLNGFLDEIIKLSGVDIQYRFTDEYVDIFRKANADYTALLADASDKDDDEDDLEKLF